MYKPRNHHGSYVLLFGKRKLVPFQPLISFTGIIPLTLK